MLNKKFKTAYELKLVFDKAGKPHMLRFEYFDPPLTFVKGKGYTQV